MTDWRKLEYKQPGSDPLAESDDFKYGVGGIALIAFGVACVAGLAYLLIAAFA